MRKLEENPAIQALEQMADFVLVNANLDEKNKADALKVIDCFHYIGISIDSIGSFIPVKDKRNSYPNKKDFDNRVLRDKEGISFHIGNFKTSEEACTGLTAAIEQFTGAFTQLNDDDKCTFIRKLKYDEAVGCLEARISASMEFAERCLNSSIKNLDDLMYKVRSDYQQLSDDPKPNFVHFAIIKLAEVKVCFHHGREQELTAQLIRRYAREFLEEGPEEEKPEEPAAEEPVAAAEEPVAAAEEPVAAAEEPVAAAEPAVTVEELRRLPYYTNEQIDSLIKRASVEVINKALSYKSFYRSNDFLYTLVIRRGLNCWETFVRKASGAVPADAVCFERFLIDLLSNRSSQDCLKILKALPGGLVSRTLAHGSIGFRGCALFLAARDHSAEVFMKLIEKASVAAIDAALNVNVDAQLEDPEELSFSKENALFWAARNQTSVAFIKLIEKASPKAISDNLGTRSISNGLSAFHEAADHQTTEAFMCLVEKASVKAIWKALALNCFIGRYVYRTDFFDILEKLPAEAFDAFLKKIENKLRGSGFFKNSENLNRLLAVVGTDLGKIQATRDFLNRTNLTGRLDFEVKLRWDLLQEGRYCPLGLYSTTIYKALTAENGENEALALAQANELLMKSIRVEHWPDFLRSMEGNYGYRPVLRDPKTKQGEYKFIHSSGVTQPYAYRAKPPGHQYQATKKTSATLLSSVLNTPIFGMHDPQRPLVGIFMDWSGCEHRALLSKDSGTYRRRWVGDEAQVKAYAEEIKHLNFTDKNAFIEKVNSSKGIHNELLVKIKREAVQGIFVASNKPEHFDLAIQRQIAWERVSGRKIPIYYYDFKGGKILTLEQVMSAVCSSRASLDRLKSKALEISWHPGFFDKKRKCIEGRDKLMTSAAYELVSLVDQFTELAQQERVSISQIIMVLQRLEALLFEKVRTSRGHKQQYKEMAENFMCQV